MAEWVDGQFDEIFKTFDTNDNGTIEKAEIHQFLKNVQNEEGYRPNGGEPKETDAATKPA